MVCQGSLRVDFLDLLFYNIRTMFMTPNISSGREINYDLLGEDPKLTSLWAGDSKDDLVKVENKKGVVFGNYARAVGNTYVLVPHHDLFKSIDVHIRKRWHPEIWKIQTGVGLNKTVARVVYTFWDDDYFVYKSKNSEWLLELRCYNTYQKENFGLWVMLGMRNTDHGGRILFTSTRKTKRHRGKNIIPDMVDYAVDLVGNSKDNVQELFDELDDWKIEDDDHIEALLSKTSRGFFPKILRKKVKIKFEADYYNTMLDFLGVVGWVSRKYNSITSRFLYMQERLLLEVSHAFGA